jgi:hypothetical protein
MKGETHYTYEIDRWKAVLPRSFPKLPLDRKCRIKYSPVIEVVLLGALHLDQEPLAILIGTFHVNTDVLAPWILVGTFLRSVGQAGYLPLRDQGLEEQEHQAFGVSVFLE